MDLSSTQHSPSIFSLDAAICPREKEVENVSKRDYWTRLKMCQLALEKCQLV